MPAVIPSAPPAGNRAAGTTAAGPVRAPKVEEKSAPVPAPAAAPPAVREPDQAPRPEAQANGESWYKVALVHFLSNLTALVVALGLFSAALLVVLRRCGVSLQAGSRPAPADPCGPAAPLPHAVSGPEDLAADPSKQFDLGPTYEEEMRLKEEAARQQEEAVLRQLFEENLHLREQIGELCAAE